MLLILNGNIIFEKKYSVGLKKIDIGIVMKWQLTCKCGVA